MKRLIGISRCSHFFSLRDKLIVNILGGKQLKQGHLPLASWKWILVEIMFCGKNALSVLRAWKKPSVKTLVFQDIHIQSHV